MGFLALAINALIKQNEAMERKSRMKCTEGLIQAAAAVHPHTDTHSVSVHTISRCPSQRQFQLPVFTVTTLGNLQVN